MGALNVIPNQYFSNHMLPLQQGNTNTGTVSCLPALRASGNPNRVAGEGNTRGRKADRKGTGSSRLTSEELCVALGGNPRPGTKRYTAYCPVHENDGRNHQASLHIMTGDNGHVIFVCRAGCAQHEIIEGLKSLGLWNRGEFQSKGQQVSALDFWVSLIWSAGCLNHLNSQITVMNRRIHLAFDLNQTPEPAEISRYQEFVTKEQELREARAAGRSLAVWKMYQRARQKNETLAQYHLFLGNYSLLSIRNMFEVVTAQAANQ